MHFLALSSLERLFAHFGFWPFFPHLLSELVQALLYCHMAFSLTLTPLGFPILRTLVIVLGPSE